MNKMRMWLSVLALPMLLMLPAAAVAQSPYSLEQLQRGALAGEAWAQLNLGAAYDNGMANAPRDPKLARYWYRKAAEQGLDKAQFALAHALATGFGGEQDEAQARIWMRKAAEQGMSDAQYLLGVMLIEGLGGRVSFASEREGRQWLRRAAAADHAHAARYLAELKP